MSYGYNDAPQYPSYVPAYYGSQNLTPWVDQQLSGINANTEGLDKFRKEALRTGQSPWAALANEQQSGLESDAREKAMQGISSQTAKGRSDLAMRGGLSSGASERIAEGAVKSGLDANQQIGRQGSLNRMQIATNDEQNRMQQLGMLPNMENQQTQTQLQKVGIGQGARAADIQNAAAEAQRQNQYNMGVYQTQGQMYGASKQADATANSGGSWLCSESKVLNKSDWRNLRKLRIFSLRKNRELAQFYLLDCFPLIKKMKEAGYDWSQNDTFIYRVIELVILGKMDEAYNLYIEHTKNLLRQYWPAGLSHGLEFESRKDVA